MSTLVARLMEADGGTLDLQVIVKTRVSISSRHIMRPDNRQ
jgi:hypothetical protein